MKRQQLAFSLGCPCSHYQVLLYAQYKKVRLLGSSAHAASRLPPTPTGVTARCNYTGVCRIT